MLIVLVSRSYCGVVKDSYIYIYIYIYLYIHKGKGRPARGKGFRVG